MKRSEINHAINKAKILIDEYKWALPKWAYWSKSDYNAQPAVAEYLRTHQMGWDVTDFGRGNFNKEGIILFCVRNGMQNIDNEKPYAEKLLFMQEDQVIPFHSHKIKLEDIINRGGGNLVLEFVKVDDQKNPTQEEIRVMIDGELKIIGPYEPLILQRGQSVTVERFVYHKFYTEKGTGMAMAGEVSQVNDDKKDNYFLEPVGRFTKVEEDESILHPLWNEI